MAGLDGDDQELWRLRPVSRIRGLIAIHIHVIAVEMLLPGLGVTLVRKSPEDLRVTDSRTEVILLGDKQQSAVGLQLANSNTIVLHIQCQQHHSRPPRLGLVGEWWPPAPFEVTLVLCKFRDGPKNPCSLTPIKATSLWLTVRSLAGRVQWNIGDSTRVFVNMPQEGTFGASFFFGLG